MPDVKDGLFQTAWCKLYSLKVINEHNLKFVSEREYISEDLLFQLDYFSYSNKAVVSDDVLYYYRFNDNSLTTVYKENLFLKEKKVYLYVKNRFCQMNMDKEAFLRLGKLFFVQIYGALGSEIPSISKKSIGKCLITIKQILNDEIVGEALEGYPINKLKFKQRVFIYLVKYRQAHVLFLCMLFKSMIKKKC